MSLTSSAPSANNYKLGGARLYVQRKDTTGYICLGNIVAPSINPLIETLDHFTSFSGTRRKDRIEITAESYEVDFTVDEFNTNNLLIALRGASTSSLSQSLATARTNNVAVIPGRTVALDRRQVSSVVITDSSDTFTEGTDYTVDYQLGLIRWDDAAMANASVLVTFNCAAVAGLQFNPGTLQGIQRIDGFFIAFCDNTGGIMEWTGVNGTLSTNGAIDLLDTDWSKIPMKLSLLASTSATQPFGQFSQY